MLADRNCCSVLRCLCPCRLQDTVAEEISSRDKQALSYCTAIRATYPSKGGPATVEMSFSSNPFFSNSLLKRCLGDPKTGVEEVTTDIQWKDTAHKLTVKVFGDSPWQLLQAGLYTRQLLQVLLSNGECCLLRSLDEACA
jgi:hypothetical protein